MMDKASIINYLNRCSKCGGCMAVCPLYAETTTEPLVARGKLFLIRNYLDGELDLSQKMKELMSLCLLCKACTAQCPNGIPVDQLVLAIRQEIAHEKGISFVKKNAFQHLLQNNGSLTAAAKLAYLYQHSGLQWMTRKTGILDALGGDLAQKEKLLPPIAWRSFRSQIPEVFSCNKPKLRVAYYTGCLTNYVFHSTGYALINLLRHHQIEIVIPDQWCCGIPALASGDEQSAVQLAHKNIRAFQEAGVDAVITDCASCGSMLREYADLVGTEEARSFSEKVLDISQFLVDVVSFQPGEKEVPLVVTYHDPCHLRRGQGVVDAPRKLLRSLPGVVFKEMKESDRCCGAAGSFNLTYYDLSQRIGSRKAHNILETGADAVVTGCPSCIMQLQHVLSQQDAPIKVLHIAELLNYTY
jgi:glycolate oxidase iron-sulfur subunit